MASRKSLTATNDYKRILQCDGQVPVMRYQPDVFHITLVRMQI